MVESDTISSLLQLYRQCKDRGETVSLGLDARNGNNFITFSLQSTAKCSLDNLGKEGDKTKLI